MGNVIILNLGAGKRGRGGGNLQSRPACRNLDSLLFGRFFHPVRLSSAMPPDTDVGESVGREAGKSDSAVGRTIRSRWLFRSAHPRSITRRAASRDIAEVS